MALLIKFLPLFVSAFLLVQGFIILYTHQCIVVRGEESAKSRLSPAATKGHLDKDSNHDTGVRVTENSQEQNEKADDKVTMMTRHPLSGMVRSVVAANGVHNATQRRVCIALTAVPSEMRNLKKTITEVLNHYKDALDCVHLSIPERSMRFSRRRYPSTANLVKTFNDPRFIIHRLFDYGPMTRYVGPMAFEKHPDTAIIAFDADSENMHIAPESDLLQLIKASREIDESAVWCNQGEDFTYNTKTKEVKAHWDTFGKHFDHDIVWNQVFFCRAVNGVLIKPKHFAEFWYNQSDYHESCFWDDDRWVGFQVGRQGFPMKAIDSSEGALSRYEKSKRRRRLGSLTQINEGMDSTQNCIGTWMEKHPEAFPEGRITAGKYQRPDWVL